VVVIVVVVLRAPKPASPGNTVKNLPTFSFSEKFPTGVPIEAGAIIARNYNPTSPDGKTQATRSFDSRKSLGGHFALYEAFIMDRKSGWTYLNEVNDPAHKALFASGANGILNINILAGSASRKAVVEISFLSTATRQ
jgi:hypothetical protein